MAEDRETWKQLTERLAYILMSGIARGTPAIDLASLCASQTLRWRVVQDQLEKADQNKGSGNGR